MSLKYVCYTVQSQVTVQIQTEEFNTILYFSQTNVCTFTQACSYCIVTDSPSPLNSSWDLVGAGCCQVFWEEEEGEGRSGSGSFVWRLKEKGRTSTCQLHVEVFTIIIISMSSIWPSIPFCFSLKFCHNNTAVTTPNTVTVATHSATKEAVVVVQIPAWKIREGTSISMN